MSVIYHVTTVSSEYRHAAPYWYSHETARLLVTVPVPILPKENKFTWACRQCQQSRVIASLTEAMVGQLEVRLLHGKVREAQPPLGPVSQGRRLGWVSQLQRQLESVLRVCRHGERLLLETLCWRKEHVRTWWTNWSVCTIVQTPREPDRSR